LLLAKQGFSGRFDGPFLCLLKQVEEIEEKQKWNKQMKKYDF